MRRVPSGPTLASAHLLIHATEGWREGGLGVVGVLSRWRAWARKLIRLRPPAARLEIVDLQGRSMFATDDLSSVVGVTLPPGTYHVTLRQGAEHRRYTVALEQGVTFELHLRATRALR
jgi:hypothetical protein